MEELFHELDNLTEYHKTIKSKLSSTEGEVQKIREDLGKENEMNASFSKQLQDQSKRNIKHKIIENYNHISLKALETKHAALKQDLEAAKAEYLETQHALQLQVQAVVSACRQEESPFTKLMTVADQLPGRIETIAAEVEALTAERDNLRQIVDNETRTRQVGADQMRGIQERTAAAEGERAELEAALNHARGVVEELRARRARVMDGDAMRRRDELAVAIRRAQAEVLRQEAIRRTANLEPPTSAYLLARRQS